MPLPAAGLPPPRTPHHNKLPLALPLATPSHTSIATGSSWSAVLRDRVPASAAQQTTLRSSFVSGLNLRTSQLGPGGGSRAGRSGGGGGKARGMYGALVQQAQSEVHSLEQLQHVKHRILGPVPPTAEALRGALADPELRHRVLRLRRVHHTAPLVIAECEDDGAEHEDGPETGGGGASTTPHARLGLHQIVRLIMARPKFDRACGGQYGGGARFVLFSPWVDSYIPQEAGGEPQLTILATHAEALPPSDDSRPGLLALRYS